MLVYRLTGGFRDSGLSFECINAVLKELFCWGLNGLINSSTYLQEAGEQMEAASLSTNKRGSETPNTGW